MRKCLRCGAEMKENCAIKVEGCLLYTSICTEGKETGSNTLEFSSIVFVSVIGVLGYKEDFKALLQNGYTRKYISVSYTHLDVYKRQVIFNEEIFQ